MKKELKDLLDANVKLQAELAKNVANATSGTDDADDDATEIMLLMADIISMLAVRDKIIKKQNDTAKEVFRAGDSMDFKLAKEKFEEWCVFDSLQTKTRILKMKYGKKLPEEVMEIITGIGQTVENHIRHERLLQEEIEKEEKRRRREKEKIAEPPERTPEPPEREMEEEWELDEWER